MLQYQSGNLYAEQQMKSYIHSSLIHRMTMLDTTRNFDVSSKLRNEMHAVFKGKHRYFTLLEVVDKLTVCSTSRHLCFKAASLAAATYNLIVEEWEMTVLAREARLAVVELSADNHSDTKTPTEIQENHIFLSIAYAIGVFAVSHCA